MWRVLWRSHHKKQCLAYVNHNPEFESFSGEWLQSPTSIQLWRDSRRTSHDLGDNPSLECWLFFLIVLIQSNFLLFYNCFIKFGQGQIRDRKFHGFLEEPLKLWRLNLAVAKFVIQFMTGFALPKCPLPEHLLVFLAHLPGKSLGHVRTQPYPKATNIMEILLLLFSKLRQFLAGTGVTGQFSKSFWTQTNIFWTPEPFEWLNDTVLGFLGILGSNLSHEVLLQVPCVEYRRTMKTYYAQSESCVALRIHILHVSWVVVRISRKMACPP